MKNISKKELALAAKMLELASDQFSNHGCNDVDGNVYDGWTLEERQQFVKDFHEWNSLRPNRAKHAQAHRKRHQCLLSEVSGDGL